MIFLRFLYIFQIHGAAPDGFKRLEDGLRPPQDGPKTPQYLPKMAPRRSRDGPKTAQERPKTAKNQSKTYAGCAKIEFRPGPQILQPLRGELLENHNPYEGKWPPEGVPEASWAVLGPSWAVRGRLWVVLGRSWAVWEPPRRPPDTLGPPKKCCSGGKKP